MRVRVRARSISDADDPFFVLCPFFLDGVGLHAGYPVVTDVRGEVRVSPVPSSTPHVFDLLLNLPCNGSLPSTSPHPQISRSLGLATYKEYLKQVL